ncbi:outer membrane beta-barrel protein [Francisellaceae bacterium]|nr:outer membrane beta-barrel protein [Francisellaceae bacterium]
MHLNSFQKFCITVLVLFIGLFSFAESIEDRQMTGQYIGGMIGAARISHDIPSNNTVSYGPYFSAIFGYDWSISQNDKLLLGIEVSPAYSSQYYNADDNDVATDRSEINLPILMTGTYILTNGVNFSLKGGLAFQTEFDSSSSATFENSGWHPVIAGKIGYLVKKNVNIFAQYMYIFNQSLFNNNNMSSNFIALGVLVNL